MQEVEVAKLNSISEMSTSLLDLKKKICSLNLKQKEELKDKCEMVKKSRLEEYKTKSHELQEKERELTRKTNELVDELVATCEDTPFHDALIKILRNLKGIKKNFFPQISVPL